ncbi:MAG: hypothetical protein ABSF33_15130, partial [Acidimicrobiales bacterium]
MPDVPAIHRRFDYSVPPSLATEIRLGSRVRIDLHGRRIGGWVVEDDVGTTPGVAAKPLSGSSGMGPPAPVVSVAEWAAWRWAGPTSSFLGTASPNRVVRAGGSESRPGTRPGQLRPGHEPGPASPGGGSVAIVDGALAASGGCAVVRLAPALDSTLLVLEVVHRTGPAGVLVLVPSRARAEQTVTRLRGAGVAVAMMPEMWERARTGTAVVVGTRAAAWAPIERLVAAVVL